MYSLIVILGPTASGKSSLGVQLARRYHGVVVSADSRQVYKGLDIGTAKISRSDRQGVPHFLLDVVSPRGQYSVARYVRDVQRVLQHIPADQPVFLVGGSPFYIDAITKQHSFSPVPPDPALRRRLDRLTTQQLVQQVRRYAPERFAAIDQANRRRLIRAIEIARYKGPTHTLNLPAMRILKIGLRVPSTTLTRRLRARIVQRWPAMVKEMNALHRSGLSWKKMESFGLEYRWVSRYCRGLLTESLTMDHLLSDSQDFVRRQLTWWKRDQDIHWIDRPTKASSLIKTWL